MTTLKAKTTEHRYEIPLDDFSAVKSLVNDFGLDDPTLKRLTIFRSEGFNPCWEVTIETKQNATN